MPNAAVELQSRYGKLHVHRLAAGTKEGQAALTPLICLHPAPFDGSYFAEFARLFAGERDVLAPDYPGYGRSASPPEAPSIDDYATALLQPLCELTDGRMHLLGFHTGCLVACEMARQQPQNIADLILIDVPYFNGAAQRGKYAESVTEQQNSWGFGAAFSYPCAARLGEVTNRSLLIATGSNLAAPTQEAAAVMTNAQLENCGSITRPAFKNGGKQFAELIRAFLHD